MSEQMSMAFPSKEEGQEAALASYSAMHWKDRFQDEVRTMERGRRFTSEDVTAVIGLPNGAVLANANNAVGAMMTALAKRGLIVKTGARVPSRRKSSHGAELIVWERT